MASRRGRWRRWAPGLLVLAVVIAGLAAYTAYRGLRAGHQAQAAKAQLLAAERDLAAHAFDQSRADLVAARASLARMKAQLNGLGPLLPMARLVPVVGTQVRAVETFQSAGALLAGAGTGLVDTAQGVLDTSDAGPPLSGMVDKLRAINQTLATGAASVRAATQQVLKLKGAWLIGPIGKARDDLLRRLPRYAQEADSAEEGVVALIRFAGGDGARRYLFLSQNPDEIRPTGGFIGTYGVLTAAPGSLALDSFQPVGTFLARHPNANLPAIDATNPFRFANIPASYPHQLANVNSTADFTVAGAEAAALWNGAGEPPVDGVVSFTPAFLARILGVLGPVPVPGYSEVVDQGNLIDRFEYYTQQLEVDPTFDVTRKGFLAALGEAVMGKLLAAPSAQWPALAQAVGQGFSAREAMAWSSEPSIETTLAHRGWDGTLPETTGDFFYDAEFGYPAKADRVVQRVFDDHVELHTDGSARITTTVTITDTAPASTLLNPGAMTYLVLYGPKGAVLDRASDPPKAVEKPLSGHPAAGWLINAPPLGSAKVTVVWDVKSLAHRVSGGSWQYSLRWLRIPDHTGDVLNLQVDLPKGWRWKGAAPPARVDLDHDLDATWTATTGSFF